MSSFFPKQRFDFDTINHISIPSMASSTSSIHKSFKYDVYLSFSGIDTRMTFITHLYAAFQRQGIHVCKDEDILDIGSNIAVTIAIQDSKFIIIVFSKNYASSSVRLDELVTIMESHKTVGQTVCPVFYDVKPSEVRKQIGAVGEAFAENSKEEAAGKWRWALQEAASLIGWDLNPYRPEAGVIDEIVKEISSKVFKYDVFLNFRGDDTRDTFVGHLYAALKRKGIHTFKDNVELEKGRRIDELFKAIEASKFFIIVFSKTYASSSWCLNELVKIMKCQNAIKRVAYPIFYDVEPSEVRDQDGAVGEAIAKHNTNGEFGKWKEALNEGGNLVGWTLRKRNRDKVIKEIVEQISLKLTSF